MQRFKHYLLCERPLNKCKCLSEFLAYSLKIFTCCEFIQEFLLCPQDDLTLSVQFSFTWSKTLLQIDVSREDDGGFVCMKY